MYREEEGEEADDLDEELPLLGLELEPLLGLLEAV